MNEIDERHAKELFAVFPLELIMPSDGGGSVRNGPTSVPGKCVCFFVFLWAGLIFVCSIGGGGPSLPLAFNYGTGE